MKLSGLTHLYSPSHLLSHLCYHLAHLYVCVYVLTIIGSCAGDEIVQGPRNVAVLVGDQARLNCTVQLTGDRVHWRYYSLDGDQPIDIYKSNEGVVGGFEDDYDVIISEEDDNNLENHDLIIKEVRDDLTGKYDCDLPLAGESAADVVAVSELPCFPEPGEVTVDEGDVVSLGCQSQFSGYGGPVLMWMDEFNARPPQDEIREDDRVSAVSNVTTEGSHDQKNLYCWLRFDASANGKPAPDYTDYCVTYYMVNHPVTGVGFSPDPDDFTGGTMQLEVGEEINCTASGRPEPQMRWESSTDGLRVEGSMLKIEHHMMDRQQHYTCYASNVVKDEQYTAQNDVTFYAIAPSAIGAATSCHVQWTSLVVLITLTLAVTWS